VDGGEGFAVQATDLDWIENYGWILTLAGTHTKNGRVLRVWVAPELATEIRSRVGFLLPRPKTTPRQNYDWLLRRIRVEVADFTFHRLRHTFAKRWREAGGNELMLSHHLGHRSVLSVTQGYGAATDELAWAEARRVHDRLEALSGNIPEKVVSRGALANGVSGGEAGIRTLGAH